MTVETSGDHKMKAVLTGHAFKILSETLYSDKVLAAVRETMCNALDAHTMVGKGELPFFVHLPSADEPFFAVRDHGPGLSKTQVFTTFSTYFLSDKIQHSGEQIGGLGLGSKSGLAVASVVTIISYFGGEKSTYTMFFDEAGEPTVSAPLVEPSDEPNGIEIRIPVEPEDYREFHKKTAAALEFFNPLPVIANSDIQPGRRRSYMEGSNFTINALSERESSAARAILGVNPYPIQAGKIKNLQPMHALVLNLPIDIHFPLGSIGYVPSREHLSYDKARTLPALVRTLEGICRELPKLIEADFAHCQTRIEAHRHYAARTRASQTFGKITQITQGVSWQGKLIASDKMPVYLERHKGLRIVEIKKGRHNSISFAEVGYYAQKAAQKSPHGPEPRLNVASESGVIVFDNDHKHKPEPLVRAYFAKDQLYRQTKAYELPYGASAAYIIDGPEHLRAAFLDEVAGLQVMKVTSLIPEKKKVERVPVSAKLISNTYRYVVDVLDKENLYTHTADLNEPEFYVVTNKGEVVQPGLTNAAWTKAYHAATTHGLFDKRRDSVYVVPTTISKQFVKAEGWKDFYPAMRQKAIRKLKRTDLTPAAHLEITDNLEISTRDRDRLKAVAAHLPADHLLVRFLALLVQHNDKRDEMVAAREIAEAFNLPLELPAVINPAADNWARIMADYPLIQLVLKREYDYDREKEVTEEYAVSTARYMLAIDATQVVPQAQPQPQARRVSWLDKQRAGGRRR